ncbi:hypothetical protein [Agitococcus lubricus]|uniref:Uncharacterized protein n=1 Tax=Agitococcus lubricus TaxID=1077255 RepID=A0A2T5J443_9GAMM|nr:hypothetical protein [Agitococcus lubricus]PTQ91371.1 hypothetical protein C8N29_101444 [Agitococcus lubricus]
MLKKILIMLVMMLAQTVHAAFDSIDQANQWLQHYYQQPEPANLVTALKDLNQHMPAQDWQKATPFLFGFIAGAVQQQPQLATQLLEELKDTNDNLYSAILIGVWYADLAQPNTTALVQAALINKPALQARLGFLMSNAVNILALTVERGPWVLDAWWGHFFATGQGRAVEQIISATQWLDDSHKEAIMAKGKAGLLLLAIAGAAKWSLLSNAKVHPRVLTICQTQVHKQPPAVANQLNEILAKITQ